jgi:hypothetical protein
MPRRNNLQCLVFQGCPVDNLDPYNGFWLKIPRFPSQYPRTSQDEALNFTMVDLPSAVALPVHGCLHPNLWSPSTLTYCHYRGQEGGRDNHSRAAQAPCTREDSTRTVLQTTNYLEAELSWKGTICVTTRECPDNVWNRMFIIMFTRSELDESAPPHPMLYFYDLF